MSLDKIANIFVLPIIESRKVVFCGLSIRKVCRVAKSHSNKERAFAPSLETIVPIFSLSNRINKGGIGISIVNGVQAIYRRKEALETSVVIVVDILSMRKRNKRM
jgi:hypothetical protein